MNQAIVQEIINDIITIDPDLKNIKSELEKLVQELIANKPETPFTKEFKDSLKAQIIGAINEQKILYEEKAWDWKSMLHSLKFWMIGVPSLATCFLVFALFQYFDGIQQPTNQIVYKGTEINNSIFESGGDQLQEEGLLRAKETSTKNSRNPDNKNTPVEGFGGGAENRAENVMMLALPETEEDTTNITESSTEFAAEKTRSYTMMEDTSLAKDETMMLKTAASPASPTPCETSKQFLSMYNLSETSEDTTKTFTYNKQLYKATISFTNNNITIDHIGTEKDSNIQSEIPNLNLFLKNNYFDISTDYEQAIIETGDSFIEYYFPRHGKQEGITARIDTATNIIFSIKNICIY